MNILSAAFCIFLFSLTIPATRIAALEMPPMLVVSLRLLGAGLICAMLMGVQRWTPPRRIWFSLALTSAGSVLGFSLFTAYAFSEVPGSHGALGLAALPAVTAGYSTWRDRVNPGAVFWGFAILGTLLSGSYFFSRAVTELYFGDLLLGFAVLSATLGYVEGGRLSREYGGIRVTCWAVLIAMPVILLLAWFLIPVHTLPDFSANAWFGVLYLALISQSSAMFLWYKVLAKGPMEKVALVQLLQPFFTLVVVMVLLGEHVDWLAWVLAALVVACIFGANRSRA